MGFAVVACAVALFSSGGVQAKSFLQAREEDLEQALQSQLMEVVTTVNYEVVKEKLHSMFASLPKGPDGGLEPSTVRYALQRYFKHQYGWHINGLGRNAGSNLSLTAALRTPWTPGRIQVVMEKLLKGHGVDLENLAAFAATIADLVHGEVAGRLHEVFDALNLDANSILDDDDSDDASRAYILSVLADRQYRFWDRKSWEGAEKDWAENYPHWDSTLDWATDLSQTFDHFHMSRRNPFVRHVNHFDDIVGFMEQFGQQFGSFQTIECLHMKERLMDLESGGSGRVPLTRFYGAASSEFHFSETLEYLRHTHSVDESDPSRPTIIIPNYINSKSNCMKASAFYSICCPDECERLMAQIEREISSPIAPPMRIAQVVSTLESDTVHSPRNLSSTLLARLDDIAKMHDGSVPLHGRLFAQWMHHAFPRECSFPHVADHDAMLPEDWRDAMKVNSVEVSENELMAHKNHHLNVEDGHLPSLPWIHEEDLVARHSHLPSAEKSGPFTKMRVVFAIAGIAAFAGKIFKLSPSVGCVESKDDRYLI